MSKKVKAQIEINLALEPLNMGIAAMNTSIPLPLVNVAKMANSNAKMNLNFELRSIKK